MKKTLLGLGLIGLAFVILFKDLIGLEGLPLWPMAGAIGFGILALNNLFDGEWVGAGVLGVLSFSCINSIFDWFEISLGTLILVAVLLGIGFSMILKPKKNRIIINGKPLGDYIHEQKSDTLGKGESNGDTVFGNATRYVNDDNFIDVGGNVVFSGNAIYFDNATILGDVATYSGDAVFSRVTLYVPKNWKVEFTGDRVFSTLDVRPSGELTDKTLMITGDYVFSRLMVVYI